MFEPVIGIEIHCELKTNTKMFSGAPLGYGDAPNTAINEIDISMPGTLPSLNAEAVNYAVRLSKALKMDIDPLIRFDRKNYFYSDLPKGYQITQQFHPLGQKGSIDIKVADAMKHIRINRLHMEEDTAKQTHDNDKTLIDFNRAGTPLLEIVTEADFRSGAEAAAYVEAIRLLVIYLGISDGRMDEGSLRCDVNISMRPVGTETFGTKVEIKNLNSINNIQKAIDFEMVRQSEMLRDNQAITSQTLRFDENKQETVLMRDKETTVDYRYFVDPNIPPTQIPENYLNQTIPELPWDKKDRYISEYELSEYDADVLVRNVELANYFDIITDEFDAYKLIVNWLTQDVMAVWDEKGHKTMVEWLNPKHFITFLKATQEKRINSKQAKEVFKEMLSGNDPEKIIKEKGMVQISDEATLIGWINEVLEANPSIIDDYKNGLDKSIKFVVGQVMKNSKGQANPALTNKLVISELDKK